jgi:hypothetical protein
MVGHPEVIHLGRNLGTACEVAASVFLDPELENCANGRKPGISEIIDPEDRAGGRLR